MQVNAQETSCFGGDVLVTGPVKAILAKPMSFAQLAGQRVGERVVGNRRVKGRVEDCQLRQFREPLSTGANQLQCRRIMKRSQVTQFIQFLQKRIIDQDWLPVQLTAVYHSVRDGINAHRG